MRTDWTALIRNEREQIERECALIRQEREVFLMRPAARSAARCFLSPSNVAAMRSASFLVGAVKDS